MLSCPICLNEFPQLDAHHIYPKAFGGPANGPLFNLCSGCHQAVHSQAKSRLAKTNKQFLFGGALDRAEFLVTAIVKAKYNYDRGIIPTGGGGAIHEISTRVTRQQLTLLHGARKRLNYPSLEAMWQDMAKAIIIKAYGALPEDF